VQRVVVLEQGRPVLDGSREQVLAQLSKPGEARNEDLGATPA
jgi:hypothetical protein